MAELLPAGIPRLETETLRPELVAYLHGEATGHSRAIIAYYLAHDPALKADYEALQSLARVLKHVPSVEPSRRFVRRVIKELPRLTAAGWNSVRLKNLIARTGWGIEDRLVFLIAFARYRLSESPGRVVAVAALVALLFGGIAWYSSEALAPAHRSPWAAASSPRAEPDQSRLPPPIPSEFIDRRPAARAPATGPGMDDPTVVLPERPLIPEGWVDPWEPPPPPPRHDTFLARPLEFGQMIPPFIRLRAPKAEVAGHGWWYANRAPEARERALGTRERAAIAAGRDWLVNHQQRSGAWLRVFHADGAEPARTGPTDTSTDASEAATYEATSLALLALLGDGVAARGSEPPRPKGISKRAYRDSWLPRYRRARQAVRLGLRFLTRQQDGETGRFGPERPGAVIVPQGMAALALIEDYGLSTNPRSRPYIRRAVNYLLAARNSDGFWGTLPNDEHSALTPTFWAMFAIRSAIHVGAIDLDPDGALFEEARGLLEQLTYENGMVAERVSGAFPQGWHRPTSIGMVLNELINLQGKLKPEALRKQIARLDAQVELLGGALPAWRTDAEAGTTVDFLTWFYASLGLAHAGDESAPVIAAWRNALIKTLTEHQAPATAPRGASPAQREAVADLAGSWPPVGPLTASGRAVTTALGVLALQNRVRYRWLTGRPNAPAPDRSSSGR